MAIKIFYSWQSELPSGINWDFIGDALENVATQINAEIEKANRDEIEIYTGTKKAKGTVNIADTILKKIDECQILVADLSFIGRILSNNSGSIGARKSRRKMPNPNVLFELGYAWQKLKEERIIIVTNIGYGKFEELPFDLRGKSIISYSLKEDADAAEKTSISEKLEKDLKEAFLLIITEDKLNEDISNKPQLDIVDSYVLELQNADAQKEYEKFREDWFSSSAGIIDVQNSAKDIFGLILDKFSPNREIFSRRGIGLTNNYRARASSHYSCALENPQFGCEVELKNLSGESSLNTARHKVFLEIRLYKKVIISTSVRFPNETIEEIFLYPDINFNREVIWHDIKDKTKIFPEEEICNKVFNLFFSQIQNPAPTRREKREKEEETRGLLTNSLSLRKKRR